MAFDSEFESGVHAFPLPPPAEGVDTADQVAEFLDHIETAATKWTPDSSFLLFQFGGDPVVMELADRGLSDSDVRGGRCG
jgi:hypothetical protein